MKTKPLSSFLMRHTSFTVLLTAFILFLTAPRAPAQDTVTVSAVDFQRLVYSAHLHTELTLHPELGASLRVLLEMQRRNPNADPVALADLLRQALQIYRTSAPFYVRTNGYPDEILAAYLDALRQVPAHTKFVSADLTLLNLFMLGSADYNSNVPPATLICSLVDSGNQRLYSSESEALKRQTLVDDCVARARDNAGFATALDQLLVPETGVSLRDTPAQIIGDTNSPLHDDLTMTNLLALSEASGDGSLTISSNQVMNLFTDEMQTVWDTVHTNLTTLSQINQSQPDLLSYLTNQAAIDANVQLWTAVQQNQPARIASATAAILVQSQLTPANSDHTTRVGTDVAEMAIGIGAMCFTKGNSGFGAIIAGGLDIFNLFTGDHTQQGETLRQIGNIQTMVGDLSTNMDYRFDRVDQSLTTIFDTLNTSFSKIEITLDSQGRQIAQLNGSVDDIRSALVDVQGSLDRLEQDVFLGFETSERNTYLITPANAALFYDEQNPGKTMSWNEYAIDPDYENDFYTYATSDAADNNLSPSLSLDLASADLAQQLAARPLAANLNYIQQFLTFTLNVTTVATPNPNNRLPNPQEWFMGAYAYLQLAAENPMLFREKGLRLPALISAGQNLADFLGSLTFSGTNVNWDLWNALENCYVTNLISFNGQVAALEGTYATNNSFALGLWRQWDVDAPRVTATATGLLGMGKLSPGIPAGLTNVVAIAACKRNKQDDSVPYFGLALSAGGTVVQWGQQAALGQPNIPVPAGLSNVVAIAAGGYFSLALLTNGTVVGWGDNYFGEATGVAKGPSSGPVTIAGQLLTNVVAIAAGEEFALALKADGTIVGWGNGVGSIPSGLSNVVAIATGDFYSLALKADGTVVAWSEFSGNGATSVPAGLRNVVAIAAGGWRTGDFALALKADGTLVGWGDNSVGQISIPADLSNVVAIAGSYAGSLAIKADGTVVGWGDNGGSVPSGLTNVAAIAGGWEGGLFLTSTNTGGSAGSGRLTFLRAQIPARVPVFIQSCNQNTLAEMDLTGSPLDNAAAQLTGAKTLLADLLELGMPDTLANDSILHGFLYGDESLTDTGIATNFLQAQSAQLQASPTAPAPALVEWDWLSYLRFQERLNQCLTNLQATSQPEIPRLVGHTLRLLNLLRDAWTPPTNSPPPALEIWSKTNSPRLLLYGEPYMRYTLQYCDSLGAPGWTTTTMTNLEDGQTNIPPFSGSPQRFYRLMLPMP